MKVERDQPVPPKPTLQKPPAPPNSHMAVERAYTSLPSEKGRDLLRQVRTHLIETARPLMDAMVEGVTRVKVVSLHHDISTVTGEEVVLFRLSESPSVRVARNF